MTKKEQIIERLRENGCRITRQRLMLIDIILSNDCASCKEIYYKAAQKDDKIGVATVYRMINALEAVGAISRRSIYKVEDFDDETSSAGCVIVLDDDTICDLSPGNWSRVVTEGLKGCGYMKDQKVVAIRMKDAVNS